MVNINLSEKEVDLLRKSINHCLDTCSSKESNSECTDCEALKEVLTKLSKS